MLFSKCLWWCPLEYFSIFCSCLLHNSLTCVVLSHNTLRMKTGHPPGHEMRMSWSSWSPLLTVPVWPELAPDGPGWRLSSPPALRLRLWFAGAGLWSLVTAGQLQLCSSPQPIMQQASLRLCSRWDFCFVRLSFICLLFGKNNESWNQCKWYLGLLYITFLYAWRTLKVA